MKVLLLSRYGLRGASSRVRSYQYLPYLNDKDIQVDVSVLLDDSYVRNFYEGGRTQYLPLLGSYFRRAVKILQSGEYHLLWIEKELFPWLPLWVEEILLRGRIPYIVDYDDALFHRYDRHRRWVVRNVLGGKIDGVMRGAAVGIVGNEYLESRARVSGATRVEVLPSVVDLDRYPKVPTDEREKFTVGWIGSPVTSKYLRLVDSVLSDFLVSERARLLVIGAGNFSLSKGEVLNKPWGLETETEILAEIDVGIMPLTDDPWERGKCGYKLIQYMACFKPVVASPVGANCMIVEDGKNGFLAPDPASWVRALTLLKHDKDLRTRLGTEGRREVENRYCTNVTAPKLVSIMRSAARTPGTTRASQER